MRWDGVLGSGPPGDWTLYTIQTVRSLFYRRRFEWKHHVAANESNDYCGNDYRHRSRYSPVPRLSASLCPTVSPRAQPVMTSRIPSGGQSRRLDPSTDIHPSIRRAAISGFPAAEARRRGKRLLMKYTVRPFVTVNVRRCRSYSIGQRRTPTCRPRSATSRRRVGSFRRRARLRRACRAPPAAGGVATNPPSVDSRRTQSDAICKQTEADISIGLEEK